MIEIEPYCTHQPLLLGAISLTNGRGGAIVELGSGYYSTPLLKMLCGTNERRLVTLDNDADWLRQTTTPALAMDESQNIMAHTLRHDVHHIANWNDLHRYGADLLCDVAFIDLAPADLRGMAIHVMSRWATIIVIHDTETEQRHNYPGVAEAIATFPYLVTDRRRGPWTTVVSNDPVILSLPSFL